jgi:hypothetical protein
MSNKTIVTRVPKDYVNMAELLRQEKAKQGIIMSRVAAMKKLNRLIGKKGQGPSLLVFAMIIVILVIAVALFGVINFGISKTSETLVASEKDATLKADIEEKAANIPSWFDFGFAMLFFLILVIILVLTLTSDSDIFALIVTFFSLFFLGPLLMAGHNQMNAVIETMPTVFTTANFPLTVFIVNQFFIIMAFFYVLQFAVLFLRPGGVTQR